VADGDPDLFISGAPAHFTGYYPWIFRLCAGKMLDTGLGLHSKLTAATMLEPSSSLQRPSCTPIINFNSFDTGVTENKADQKDLQAVYEAMEYSRKAFKDRIPLDGAFTEVWPGPNVTTADQMKAFIKDEAWGHHASCTCPYLEPITTQWLFWTRSSGCGSSGLRVVDASVFPKIPGFYIALPIYMISEKAADVIIQDAA